MKTILVPVDFSPTSTNAAQFAADLAAFYGADIWLYHAYQIPIALSEFAYPTRDIQELQQAAEHELDLLTKTILGNLPRKIAIHTKTEMNVLQPGLTNFCNEIKPDLVVMGISGNNALTRLIVGSNTIRSVYGLAYPILVVPPRAEFIPVKKIGFACEYDLVKKTTPVALLKKVLLDFHAELHVLNVDHHHVKAGRELDGFPVNELLNGTRAEFHTIDAGEITDGVDWFIQRSKLDWLALIPKRHRLLENIFRRSHTKELLYHTHVPVLCIHE